jgi:hypothetical protein
MGTEHDELKSRVKTIEDSTTKYGDNLVYLTNYLNTGNYFLL